MNQLSFIYTAINEESFDQPILFRNADCSSYSQLHHSDFNQKQDNYLDFERSMSYVDQFLVKFDSLPSLVDSSFTLNDPIVAQNKIESLQLKTQREAKRGKKGKKVQNSPFHNYQKHLNNSLKKLVIVPGFGPKDQDFKQVASLIWKRYMLLDVKTKRILHFIFNERNEHSINEPELRNYDLLDIYRQYGEDVICRAKNYLSKLAIDQIDEQNVDGYLKTRKIKRQEGLRDYILAFKKQLQNGYLKRRVISDNKPF